MSKINFVSAAMLASISEGVNIRERASATMNNLVSEQMFAQLHPDGPTDVRYYGPQMYNPEQSAVYTPFETPWELSHDDGTITEAQISQKPKKGDHAQVSRPLLQSLAEKPFYQEFAEAAQGARTCAITMQRNWNTTDDYLSISSGTELFTDVNFPKEDALYWEDFNEAGGISGNAVNWVRISDTENFPGVESFWGPNGVDSISIRDIRQGYIGNCWVLAAISALAEHQDRVDHIMISNEFEQNGIYAMNMYSLGVPFTQIVDDWMPIRPDGNTLYAGLGQDGSYWAAVVEKMFAKWYGNWEHLVGGWMNLAVSALNGSPFSNHNHSGLTADQVWDILGAADMDRDIITAGSNFCGSDSEQTEQGVACSHAYTIVGRYTVQDASGNDVRLIKVRNPWGSEQYGGPWSDNHSNWTQAIRDQLPAVEEGYQFFGNDGVFYMDIASYMVNFSVTQVNQDTLSWHLKYFLMIEDPKDESRNTTECGGATCTKHQIRVKNNGAAQDVYVGGHVWQDRSYAWRDAQALTGQCPHMYTGWSNKHAIYKEGDSYSNGSIRWDSGEGSAWFNAESFAAGEEKIYNVVMNWDTPYETDRKRDWSLTAWGLSHDDFEVTHVDGLTTSHSPTFDDGQRSVPSEIEFPEPPPQTCWHTNFDANGNAGIAGIGDSYGDTCGKPYQTGWCGGYDTDTFNSNEMCCECGGGCDCDPSLPDCHCNPNADDGTDPDPVPNPDEDDVTPVPDPDPVPNPDEDDVTPDPVPNPDEQTCWHTNFDADGKAGILGIGDSYGDTCGKPYLVGWCGGYDTADFNSNEMCCECGGGCDCDPSLPDCHCNPNNDDDVTPVPDPDPVPNPDEDETDPTPTPDPIPDWQADFDLCDVGMDGYLDLAEFSACWSLHRAEVCPDTTATDNATCDLWNRDGTILFNMYDEHAGMIENVGDGHAGDGLICPQEFQNYYNAFPNFDWPEEEEVDPVPNPDEEDVTPMPNPDEEEVDPVPNPDEEEVDPVPTPVPTPDEEEIDNNDFAIVTQGDFDEWTFNRAVPENDVLNCGFDIRNEWHNGYYLWAGQNCEIYDLWLKIYVPKEAWNNRKTWMSSDMDCVEEICSETSDECEATFKITPANPRLGIAFDGAGEPVNFRFETVKWAPCVEEMP